MRKQIVVNAFAEQLRIHVALHHSQHGRSLTVGDSIEEFVDFRRGFGFLLDRTRILQSVQVERAGCSHNIAQGLVPFWLPFRDRL